MTPRPVTSSLTIVGTDSAPECIDGVCEIPTESGDK